jgi:hypothetical protein
VVSPEERQALHFLSKRYPYFVRPYPRWIKS